MRFTVYEQYRNGKKLEKPIAYKEVDLNINDNEATIFNNLEMVSSPVKTLEIMVAANGMMVKGLQEQKFNIWTRQEWWCVPSMEAKISHDR